MLIGVPRENRPDEKRVAAVPATVASWQSAGLDVVVETGAGLGGGFSDEEYTERGARIVPARAEVFAADLVVAVQLLGTRGKAAQEDIALVRSGQTLVAFCNPLSHPESIEEMARRGVNLFSMELVPRISRAQAMDALSSMAMLAGYKAVVIAADTLPKMFPMMITAAGTVAPARVLVIGAGVAGLQAIATAQRLGAVVTAYDIRPAVKEEVNSLGAQFLELSLETEQAEGTGGYAREMDEQFYVRQRELLDRAVADSDVVISTAAVPGRRAPVLVSREAVESMAPGSVLVDLAAEQGGNCELTQPGSTITHGAVTVAGPLNVPSMLSHNASALLARNFSALVELLIHEGAVHLDREDEIVRGALVTFDGQIVHPAVADALSSQSISADS